MTDITRIRKDAYQFRWLVLLLWVIAAAALAIAIPTPPPRIGESTDLLPPDSSVRIAQGMVAAHFGGQSDLSNVDIVFERPDHPLLPEDLTAIEQLAARLKVAGKGEQISDLLPHAIVRTPAELSLAGRDNPLISSDGRAALITVSLPYNYISLAAGRYVQHAQRIVLSASLPPGLNAAVTGLAGYGYDYAVAIERSHHKTAIVTVISVVTILLLVYRAPLAALIPLAAVSAAAVVVTKLLTVAANHGLETGTAEQIFTFVLLFGAGVDFSLLIIGRFREQLSAGLSPNVAIYKAWRSSIHGIWASALVTSCGLAMLGVAKFTIFRNAAPSVVLAILGGAAAGSTLTPALLAICGRATFWPVHDRRVPAGKRSPFWTAVSERVTAHPILTMLITILVLAIPAHTAFTLVWNYDSLFSLKKNYQARLGTEMAQRHWPVGETAPLSLAILTTDKTPQEAWQNLATSLTADLAANPDVGNVRSLTSPLGSSASSNENATVLLLAAQQINQTYLSPDDKAMRLSVILRDQPLSRQAMALAEHIRQSALHSAQSTGLKVDVRLTGPTAEMMAMRDVTHVDFERVSVLGLAAIWIMMTLALRDPALSAFIVAATVLSFLATLGLTTIYFGLLGATGLDWKVQMMLFIVLVAVGQDYSIFFAVRYQQELKSLSPGPAVRRALVYTGPVISSCGLIMAATLGSIMAGDISLLIQLGFALALGMLIDTFLVRPLLLPAFLVLRGERRTAIPAAQPLPASA